MEQKGIWLSLMDYAAYRGVSLSTIRRYIKANRVKFKEDKGKYFIYVTDDNFCKKELQEEKEILGLKLEVERLRLELRKAISENEDLKTLLMAYEQQPEIPQIPTMRDHF
jgi:DNA-binding transcriptional MerR regulator